MVPDTRFLKTYMFCKYHEIILHVTNPAQFNLLKPTGHVMHQQFNIQQFYAQPTLCLCVWYLSENKQRLVPLISYTD